MRKIICLVIAFMGVLAFADQAWAGSNVTVKITSAGFVPNEVTIRQGESVMWINEDNAPHWPASNPHPIHTGYPSGVRGCIGSSFDACHGMNKGESYTFVFDKVGTWGVHDHLNPGMLMEIRVLGNAELFWWVKFGELVQGKFEDVRQWAVVTWNGIWHEDPQAPALADFQQMDMNNQVKVIKSLAAQDPAYAWKYLKRSYQKNGQVTGNAHSLAHVVGNVAYRNLGMAGIKICDTSFSYGCLHGVTEEALKDKGPTAVNSIEKECVDNLSGRTGDTLTGCMHGMGHGLLTWEKLDVGRALGECDRLAYQWENYCYDGVFMENATDSPDWYSVTVDPWKFCAGLQAKYQFNCARYEAVGLANSPDLNLRGIAAICEQAPVETLTKPCLDSLGYKAAQDAVGNLGGIKRECLGLSGVLAQDECLASAATEVKFQRYNDWGKVSGELCAAVSESNQSSCTKQTAAN